MHSNSGNGPVCPSPSSWSFWWKPEQETKAKKNIKEKGEYSEGVDATKCTSDNGAWSTGKVRKQK